MLPKNPHGTTKSFLRIDGEENQKVTGCGGRVKTNNPCWKNVYVAQCICTSAQKPCTPNFVDFLIMIPNELVW